MCNVLQVPLENVPPNFITYDVSGIYDWIAFEADLVFAELHSKQRTPDVLEFAKAFSYLAS